jgi:uncharacterized cupin superfamily protein
MPPGTVHESAHDESFLLIEGRVRLEFPDGSTAVMSAGDAASITKGARIRWTILEPMLEFFVYT